MSISQLDGPRQGQGPIDRDAIQDACLEIVPHTRERCDDLPASRFSAKHSELEGIGQLEFVELRERDRFAGPSGETCDAFRPRFRNVQRSQDTGVEPQHQRSERASITISLVGLPPGPRPQIVRARATKSGSFPTGPGAAGTSRATTRFRLVISTTSPRLTARRIFGRLCWASRMLAVRMCVVVTHVGIRRNHSVSGVERLHERGVEGGWPPPHSNAHSAAVAPRRPQ